MRWICLALLLSNSLQLNWLLEGRVGATDPESPISPPKEEAVRKGGWDSQNGHLPSSSANIGLTQCEDIDNYL